MTKKIDPDGSAFPAIPLPDGNWSTDGGVTVRLYVATEVVAAIIGSPEGIRHALEISDKTGHDPDTQIARLALGQADALIAELNKGV